ncbi:hypothetical protein ACHAWF_018723 [Thalassiosira exigua]
MEPLSVERIISLDEYSTFQYMLAPPSTAKATIGQIQSFVFYHEPRDMLKDESDHLVFVRGQTTVANYYCCCLALLPSHVLGMSQWISAEEFPSSGKEKPKPGDILRRFRYSYYCGLLRVETLHICTDNDSGDGGKFRLVEFFDSPLSPWVFINSVFVLAAVFVQYCLRRCGWEFSLAVLVATAGVLLYLILAWTGVKIPSKAYRVQIFATICILLLTEFHTMIKIDVFNCYGLSDIVLHPNLSKPEK